MFLVLTLSLLLLASVAECASGPSLPCQPPFNKQLFCNVALPQSTRVAALVRALTLAEKISLMGDTATGVSRLGVPAYEWWSEALHGVASSPGVNFVAPTPFATSFPQPSLTAGAFDRALYSAVGEVVSIEARAMFNSGNAGLTFWAPNINIMRDPRWGRNQETPGEDPYLTSQYAIHFVRAMQGADDNVRGLRVSACPKHAYAYSMEASDGTDRFQFNAVVTAQDLNDTYLPAFQASLSPGGGAGSCTMCSYNAVNGIPSCADANFFNNIIRGRYQFDGYITSDCGAIGTIQYNHRYTNNTSTTCALALATGVDLNCGNFYQQYLPRAVGSGVVQTSLIDQALTNQFNVLMRLGWFDGALHPYSSLGPANVSTYDHTELANRAAVDAIVMLKNDGSLPLTGGDEVLVLGPNADDAITMLGNYYGNPAFIVTPFEGISAFANATLLHGVDVNSKNTSGFAAACAAVSDASTVVFVMGTNETVESENHDRIGIDLPGVQPQFIDTMLSCGAADTVFVLVVASGSSIDVSKWMANPKVNGIFWIGFPGQYGGRALGELMFGVESPSGRLPFTFYDSSYAAAVEMIDMNMRPQKNPPNPGRTYRFFTGTPVAWFGTGLSYTTFSFAWSTSVSGPLSAAAIEAAVNKPGYEQFGRYDRTQGAVTLQCNVTNTGARTSDVTVLAFVVPPQVAGAPQRKLVEFDRVHHLRPGHSQLVTFTVGAHEFVDGANKAVKGTYFVVDADATDLSRAVKLSVA